MEKAEIREGTGRSARPPAAGLGARLAALVIDLLVVAVPCSAVAVIVLATVIIPELHHLQNSHHGDDATEKFLFHKYFPIVGALQLLEATVACAYFALGHWLFGCTVGKRAMRVKVVGPGGGRLGPWRSLLRAALFVYLTTATAFGFASFRVLPVAAASLVSFGLGFCGALWLAGELASAAIDTSSHRALHDRMAGTVVVSADARG
jgi:uncharacterized RDD family membrane protein YckC